MVRETTLGECIKRVIDYRGKTPSKLGGDWVKEGVRVISALNVHGGFIDNENQIRCVTKEIYTKWMQEEIQRYDCFLASEGASLGENAIWDSDEKIVLGQRLYAIRTNPEVLDPWYFALYMQTKRFREQVDQVSTGSTVFGISQPVLLSLKLLLPKIEEQRIIGGIYRNLRNKIINNNKICSNLEAVAKLLYDYWFVQFDFPDEKGNPYKASGGKMVWNEKLNREIPEGWKVVPFCTMAQFTMGQSPKGDSYNTIGKGLPLLNGAVELAKDGIHKEKYTEESNRICSCGDWLFCVRATLGNIHKAGEVFCLGRGVAAATPKEPQYDEYVYFSLSSMIAYFEKSLSGSIIIGMTKDDITEYPIIQPSEDLLVKFSSAVNGMFNKMKLLTEENQQLTNLRDFLLPMLMNGQVKVGE